MLSKVSSRTELILIQADSDTNVHTMGLKRLVLNKNTD